MTLNVMVRRDNTFKEIYVKSDIIINNETRNIICALYALIIIIIIIICI